MGRASSELALALGICPHCHPLLMSVVYPSLWLPGLSTIRLFSVHCLFLSQTLAPSQGEGEEGSHGKTFAALLSCSDAEGNGGWGVHLRGSLWLDLPCGHCYSGRALHAATGLSVRMFPCRTLHWHGGTSLPAPRSSNPLEGFSPSYPCSWTFHQPS